MNLNNPLVEILDKILEKIPNIGETAELENPTAHFHFFNSLGRGDWYAIEAERKDDDILMFGFVKSPLGADCDEYGYFTLNQLVEVNAIHDFEVIDVDTAFEPCAIKEVI